MNHPYTDRRIAVERETDYVSAHWPADVPTDCTKLVNDEDCLAHDLPESEWCESCQTYNRLIIEMPEDSA
jgi:hypothetical protein